MGEKTWSLGLKNQKAALAFWLLCFAPSSLAAGVLGGGVGGGWWAVGLVELHFCMQALSLSLALIHFHPLSALWESSPRNNANN